MTNSRHIAHLIHGKTSRHIVAIDDERNRSRIENTHPDIHNIEFDEIDARSDTGNHRDLITGYLDKQVVHVVICARATCPSTEHDLTGARSPVHRSAKDPVALPVDRKIASI